MRCCACGEGHNEEVRRSEECKSSGLRAQYSSAEPFCILSLCSTRYRETAVCLQAGNSGGTALRLGPIASGARSGDQLQSSPPGARAVSPWSKDLGPESLTGRSHDEDEVLRRPFSTKEMRR
jgi:hypothetical protein